MTYAEGINLIREIIMKESAEKPDIEQPNSCECKNHSPTISGSVKVENRGHYLHKSSVSDGQKEIIKKIFENTPDRSVRTVAKELNLTEDKINYWKNKLIQ